MSQLLVLCITNMDNFTLIQISLFVSILVFLLLLYIFFWGNYEKKLEDSLNSSVQLLNLLPREIKETIAKSLAEEENNEKE